MKILITGSHGLVGTALIPLLNSSGHEVSRFVRNSSPPQNLEGFDAVVHLAGESIAEGRWTGAKKERIRESRVQGTRELVEKLIQLKSPPQVFVSASAIGFYGNRGSEVLTEKSSSGNLFLSEVCREWESSSKPSKQNGMRVVNLRFGIILSPKGGALGKMLLPFKLGVGGIIGSGDQFMSWIDLEDVVKAITFALQTNSLTGPMNVVGPNPVTNREFTKSLGQVLGRPTILPMPAFAAKLAFGDMADELLLSSTRVKPEVLSQAGFQFSYPQLEGSLRHLLGK